MNLGYGVDVYKKLCAARDAAPMRDRLGLPFVSLAGSNYAKARRKVLLIGKSLWATEYEGEAAGDLDLSFERSCAWSSEWLERQSTPSTPFWSFASEVVRATDPRHPDSAASCIAWSNLAKVAQVKRGAPDGVVSDAMFEAERATLDGELDEFKPDVVVLVSNNAVWRVASSIFGREQEMDTTFADGSWGRVHPRGFKLYWTRHPQGASLEWRSATAQRIASL